MFDDPKKELQRIQRELLAAEHQAAPQPKAPEEISDDWLQEAKDLIDSEPVSFLERGNPYGSQNRAYFGDENENSDRAVYLDPPPKKKKKGTFWWLLIALLEIGAIAAIVMKWLEWLR